MTKLNATITAAAMSFAGLLSYSSGHSAKAAVIYSENFNNPGFHGANPNTVSFSDRWATTDYYYPVNNINGWSFVGHTEYALNPATNDGAILLNETAGPITTASTTISGLTPGLSYRLSFLQWGDNIVGDPYVGTVAVDGSLLLTYSGTDGLPGSNPGIERSVTFIATGPSADLVFGQASPSGASPIIDNVEVSTVPEPASLALLGASLFGLGLGLIRRAAK